MMNQLAEFNRAVHVTREDLVALLNDDLAREYQAVISYVVYSQVLKGAKYMNIAAELEKHAAEELSHALILAGQIDYLGGMPVTEPQPVRTSAKAEDMLRFDLDAETDTIFHYRQRVQQCEAPANMRWPNTSAEFWCRNKTIRSRWPAPWEWKCQTPPGRKRQSTNTPASTRGSLARYHWDRKFNRRRQILITKEGIVLAAPAIAPSVLLLLGR